MLLLFFGASAKLADHRALSKIAFRNNSLSGTFPAFLIHYPTLTLMMSHNKFRGPLPDWTQNVELHWLDLSHNEFKGTLPILFAG
jgi:hypothetical protein